MAAAEGRRTLIWDLDPQAATSFYFRIKPKVKGGGKKIVRGKDKILTKLQRKVCGYSATVYMIKSGSRTKRVLALVTEDTCFVLTMRIEDEERDVVDFEKMVKSIKFAN